jgi:aspartyl/asparaginyl-tRNA synthetase
MIKQERTILKIAGIISLIGLIMLSIIVNKPSSKDTMPIITLQDIDKGAQVTILGKITAIKDTPTILIIEVQDNTGMIKVIANKKGIEKTIEKETIIKVQGTLKEYKGNKEIEATTITIRGW